MVDLTAQQGGVMELYARFARHATPEEKNLLRQKNPSTGYKP